MKYIVRDIESQIRQAIDRNKSVLLLGPRQTGKTTLIQRLDGDWSISFVQPQIRQRYERRPDLLFSEIEALAAKSPHRPLILLDEVQKIPSILDGVQDLIDRKIANFVLTGSSARKLHRNSSVNLLPGRVVSLKLDALTLEELPSLDLESHLIYGSLPGIVQVKNIRDKQTDLESYAVTYLEQEVRAEAVVRNIGHFARFLELAALESGKIVNLSKLSQEVGVAHTTISSYYEILEDCLIVERIEPITQSRTRKKLTKSQKYLFFDLGVRRVCAREPVTLHPTLEGDLFEQFVGLELLRRIRLAKSPSHLKFWRDPAGPEVDWVIEQSGQYIPIEVKWTDSPSEREIKYLKIFLKEYNCAQNRN